MEETGTDAAREDMFEKGLIGIVSPQKTVAADLSKEHVLRVLNNVIRSLVDLKSEVENGNPAALKDQLVKIQEARLDWLEKRYSGEWDEGPPATDIPTSGEEMRRWIIGKRREADD